MRPQSGFRSGARSCHRLTLGTRALTAWVQIESFPRIGTEVLPAMTCILSLTLYTIGSAAPVPSSIMCATSTQARMLSYDRV